MPGSPLFAEDRRSLVYRRVYEVLSTSPRLTNVKTWIWGFNTPADRVRPNESMLPWIRAWPLTRSVTRTATSWNFLEFAIAMEIATPGVDWTDYMNLWGAIEDAIANEEPTHESNVRLYLSGQSQGKCDGAYFTGIEQDATFSLSNSQDQIIARIGRGLILFPFGKRA